MGSKDQSGASGVLEEILGVEQAWIMTVNSSARTLSNSAGQVDVSGFSPSAICRSKAVLNPETTPLAVAVGANVLVAGTSVFGECDGVAAAVNRLYASVERLEKQPEAA